MNTLKNKSNKKTLIVTREDRRMVRKMINDMGKSLIRDGFVKVEGKTPYELSEEIWKHLLSKETPMYITLDHTNDLLKAAQSYEKEGKLEFACLLYTLWFEHWLNSILASVFRRRKFTAKLITQIIRDIDISRGKTTWLLQLLEMPPFKNDHLIKINKIIELRNSFVHYKWQPFDIDKNERKAEYEAALFEVAKTISYFKAPSVTIMMRQEEPII